MNKGRNKNELGVHVKKMNGQTQQIVFKMNQTKVRPTILTWNPNPNPELWS